MTPEQITQLLAEIMGWKEVDNLALLTKGTFFNGYGGIMVYSGDVDSYGRYFNPLTDMNHANEVVERMRNLGYGIALERWHCIAWTCIFATPSQSWKASAPTMPEAIALAALKAKNIQI